MLQKAYNTIADDYTNLPTKLKNDGVERVELSFEETDIGSTDLTDSKSMCTFAQKFVISVKKVGDFHKKRLQAARELVCTKAGGILKAKLTSKLVNCLITAKSDANQGNDATAKTDIQNDIDKFNENGLKRVSKLFHMMKDKCLMKDTANSQADRVAGMFKSKLKASIKTKSGDALTQDEMKGIAGTISDLVTLQFPQATNIVTIFTKVSRRQLRPRRALETVFEAETTYDLDAPGPVGETLNSVYGTDFTIEATGVELESTNATIEVTEEIQEINVELPSGDDDELIDTNVVSYTSETLDNTTTADGSTKTTSAASNLLVGK